MVFELSMGSMGFGWMVIWTFPWFTWNTLEQYHLSREALFLVVLLIMGAYRVLCDSSLKNPFCG
jgi:hypothetical protein